MESETININVTVVRNKATCQMEPKIIVYKSENPIILVNSNIFIHNTICNYVYYGRSTPAELEEIGVYDSHNGFRTYRLNTVGKHISGYMKCKILFLKYHPEIKPMQIINGSSYVTPECETQLHVRSADLISVTTYSYTLGTPRITMKEEVYVDVYYVYEFFDGELLELGWKINNVFENYSFSIKYYNKKNITRKITSGNIFKYEDIIFYLKLQEADNGSYIDFEYYDEYHEHDRTVVRTYLYLKAGDPFKDIAVIEVNGRRLKPYLRGDDVYFEYYVRVYDLYAENFTVSCDNGHGRLTYEGHEYSQLTLSGKTVLNSSQLTCKTVIGSKPLTSILEMKYKKVLSEFPVQDLQVTQLLYYYYGEYISLIQYECEEINNQPCIKLATCLRKFIDVEMPLMRCHVLKVNNMTMIDGFYNISQKLNFYFGTAFKSETLVVRRAVTEVPASTRSSIARNEGTKIDTATIAPNASNKLPILFFIVSLIIIIAQVIAFIIYRTRQNKVISKYKNIINSIQYRPALPLPPSEEVYDYADRENILRVFMRKPTTQPHPLSSTPKNQPCQCTRK